MIYTVWSLTDTEALQFYADKNSGATSMSIRKGTDLVKSVMDLKGYLAESTCCAAGICVLCT